MNLCPPYAWEDWQSTKNTKADTWGNFFYTTPSNTQSATKPYIRRDALVKLFDVSR
jgi:hypothetical protein